MKIRTSFDIVTEESAVDGDVAESGWIDEEGTEFEDIDEAIDFLNSEGGIYPSSSGFHPGIWYSTEADQDYKTGEWETKYFHLVDFSVGEEEDIYNTIVE